LKSDQDSQHTPQLNTVCTSADMQDRKCSYSCPPLLGWALGLAGRLDAHQHGTCCVARYSRTSSGCCVQKTSRRLRESELARRDLEQRACDGALAGDPGTLAPRHAQVCEALSRGIALQDVSVKSGRDSAGQHPARGGVHAQADCMHVDKLPWHGPSS
jgi:hypothetical protein